MSEWSKTSHTESMSRKDQARVAGVRMILGYLASRNTQEPFPAMSDHYRQPGAIGTVLLPHEYEIEQSTSDNPLK